MNGHTYIKQHYQWDVIDQKLLALWKQWQPGNFKTSLQKGEENPQKAESRKQKAESQVLILSAFSTFYLLCSFLSFLGFFL